jgi:hypothetical protein
MADGAANPGDVTTDNRLSSVGNVHYNLQLAAAKDSGESGTINRVNYRPAL